MEEAAEVVVDFAAAIEETFPGFDVAGVVIVSREEFPKEDDAFVTIRIRFWIDFDSVSSTGLGVPDAKVEGLGEDEPTE